MNSDIALIPDQRMRHLLMGKSDSIKKSTLEKHTVSIKMDKLKSDINNEVPDWLDL